VIRTFSHPSTLVGGTLVDAHQLVVAVLLLAPEGPLSYRYTSLVSTMLLVREYRRPRLSDIVRHHHKCWKVPTSRFFQLIGVGQLVRSVFCVEPRPRCSSRRSCCLGFLDLLFLFCERWKTLFDAAFFWRVGDCRSSVRVFLIAAIRSLFLMALIGFIYWSSAEGHTAKILAAFHGIAMSRAIVGIPCAAFPFVRDCLAR